MDRRVKSQINPVVILCILLLAGIITMFGILVVTGGKYLNDMLYGLDYFIDFFQAVEKLFAKNELYKLDQDSCFPPLAYIVYFFIYRLLKAGNESNIAGIATSATSYYVLVMYVGIFLVGFVTVFQNICSEKSKMVKNLLGILLCMSYPFALAIERGNMTIYILLIVLVVLLFKDSENKVYREISLILIAIAAAMKIYPAVLGFIYIAEKRNKEAIRLVIYGLLFFFLPFSLFGGIEGFIDFINNISQVGSRVSGISISGVVIRILGSNSISILVSRALPLLYTGMIIILTFIGEKGWRRIALICSLMMIVISESGSYCLLYWTIPLILFCNECKNSKMDYIHAVLFALIFGSVPIQQLGSSGLRYIFLYLQLVLICIEQFKTVSYSIRRKKNDRI